MKKIYIWIFAFSLSSLILPGASGSEKLNENLIQLATTNRPINVVREMSNGQIMIGGNFTKVNGVTKLGLARLNADGSLDNTFQPEVKGPPIPGSIDLETGKVTIDKSSINAPTIPNYYVQIWEILEDGDGYLVVGENYQYFSALYGLMRLNKNGSVDNSFRANYSERIGFSPVRAVRDLQGNVIVSGNYTLNSKNSIRIAKLDSSGNFISQFSPNPSDPLKADGNYGLAALGDGSILVALGQQRESGVIGSNVDPCRSIARYLPNGKIDDAWTVQMANQKMQFNGETYYLARVTAITQLSDGRALIVGGFAAPGKTNPNEPCYGGRGGYILVNSDGSIDSKFVDHNLQPQTAWAFKQDGNKYLLSGLINFEASGSVVMLNDDGSIDSRLVAKSQKNVDEYVSPNSVVLSNLGRYALVAESTQNTLSKDEMTYGLRKMYLNPSAPEVQSVDCSRIGCEVTLLPPVDVGLGFKSEYMVNVESDQAPLFKKKLLATGNKIKISPLKPKTKVNISIAAMNGSGYSQDSNLFSYLVPAYAPLAPELSPKSVGKENLIGILIPDMGGGVLSELVIQSKTSNGDWTDYKKFNSVQNSIRIEDMATEDRYFRASVSNEAGSSEWSNVIKVLGSKGTTTINCYKGLTLKKINGSKPSCPAGYKKK